jgi:hypothetical protein
MPENILDRKCPTECQKESQNMCQIENAKNMPDGRQHICHTASSRQNAAWNVNIFILRNARENARSNFDHDGMSEYICHGGFHSKKAI